MFTRFARKTVPWTIPAIVGFLALVFWLDRLFPPPLGVDEPVYSVEVLDVAGERLRLYTTPGGYWRLPVRARDVDKKFLAMLLTYEDRRFHAHYGVDPMAIGRAGWQALRHGRFVSGGSTLTMQTVRLLEPRPRTLGSKLIEMARAIQLEWHMSKATILDLYLSLAPYGGNIQGVRAASLLYFGKEPVFLTRAEAALLVALPQSPEQRRPDRYPMRARQARDAVLDRMAAAGLMKFEAVQRAKTQPVPEKRHSVPLLAPHFGDRLRAGLESKSSIRTTLDAQLQRRVDSTVRRHQSRQAAEVTIAVVILRNEDASVRAYTGSGDYSSTRFPGQVDIVRAIRSPGSTLKPLIYGLGFDAGMLHPETLIADRPVTVNGYAPGNFDRRYRGEISVREALGTSRNLPAVKVLRKLTPARFIDRLKQSGVKIRMPPSDHRPGLSVALGGIGVTLEQLTLLYAAMANGGTLRPPKLLSDSEAHQSRTLMSATAAWYLTDIMRDSPVPTGFSTQRERVAFKTGTSYGFRDAWAIGYDTDHTVGVWVGRPDGGFTPGLSGLHSAAPILLELFDLFHSQGLTALLEDRPEDVLLADHDELPVALKYFDRSRRMTENGNSGNGGPRIVFPPEDSLIKLTNQDRPHIQLESTGGDTPYHWLIDGRVYKTGYESKVLEWMPNGNGNVSFTVIDSQGRSASVRFSVLKPENRESSLASTVVSGRDGRNAGARTLPGAAETRATESADDR